MNSAQQAVYLMEMLDAIYLSQQHGARGADRQWKLGFFCWQGPGPPDSDSTQPAGRPKSELPNVGHGGESCTLIRPRVRLVPNPICQVKINYGKTHLVNPSHCGLRAVFLHHCAGETRDRYDRIQDDRIQDEAAADTAAPTDGRQMRNKGSYQASPARARRRVAAAGLPRQAVRPGKCKFSL